MFSISRLQRMLSLLGISLVAGLSGSTGRVSAEEVSSLPGLTSYWPCDEANGQRVYDKVGNHHGLFLGEMSHVEGKRGGAIRIQGRGHLVLPASASFNLDRFTLSAWVQYDNSGQYQYVFWKNGGVWPENEPMRPLDLWLDPDGRLHGTVHDEDFTQHDFIGQIKVADGTWHHVAFVAAPRSCAVYVDGRLDVKLDLDTPLMKNNEDLWIGARPGDEGKTKMIVDDIMLFNRSLDSRAIRLAAGLRDPSETVPIVHPRDYGYLFWRDGLHSENHKVICVQTGYYGLMMDVEQPEVLRLGRVHQVVPYNEAISPGDPILQSVSRSALKLVLKAGGKIYTCVRAARPFRWKPTDWESGVTVNDGAANYNCHMVEYGRYRQRFEIVQMRFEDAAGEAFPGDVRFQADAWPDLLRLAVEIAPRETLTQPGAELSVEMDGQPMSRHTDPAEKWESGKLQSLQLTIPFDQPIPPSAAGTVSCLDGAKKQPLNVSYDAGTDSFKVPLRTEKWDSGDPASFDRLDEYTLSLDNPTDQGRTFRLHFALEGKPFTGEMSALVMIRDPQGNPTGLIPQNAHLWEPLEATKQARLDLKPWFNYDPLDFGTWVRNCISIRLPARTKWTGRADVVYAQWGGVAKSSQYHLNLYGWGDYTPWEVAIIGAWGENVCHGMDSFATSDMLDIRPLYVTSINPNIRPRWEWTLNVGGANYLHYKDETDEKQWLDNRTTFNATGPNLTRAVYRGVTQDGKISYEVTFMLPRGNDINRSYHRIKYTVLKPVTFDYLAFFQLGTTTYDCNSPEKVAYGNAEGLTEELTKMPLGELQYLTQGIELPGKAPWWVSLHQSLKTQPPPPGGNASRGLIIRQWKARLGGKSVDRPSVSFHGTKQQQPSMLAEISPPKGLTALRKGDYVEMLVEMVILPAAKERYLGPNENLRKSLETMGDKWQGVYRQAKGNDVRVDVTKGQLVEHYPIKIRVDAGQTAEFTITGGLAYLPVSLCGLASHKGYELFEIVDGKDQKLDQAIHGNDFWQTEYDEVSDEYSRTYNVLVDAPGDQPRTRRFVFRKTL